jgi:hypothetical protein
MRLLNAGLLIVLAFVISACGGGGGGGSGSPVTSAETFQIKTALANYLTNTASYVGTVSGTYSSFPVTGTFQVT